MGKKKTSEHDFYHEIDGNRARASVSCQLLAIVFISLAIIVAVLVYAGVRLARQKLVHGRLPQSNEITLKSAVGKIGAFLNSSKTAPNSSVKITLTDAELTSLFSQAATGQEGKVKNLKVGLDTGTLTIYGTLLKPIETDFAIVTTPTVKNGKVDLVIKSASAGALPVPKIVTNKLADNLLTVAENQINKDGVTYKTVVVTPGKLEAEAFVIGKTL